MNTCSVSEEESPPIILPKYTQLSEGDPYFFDFREKQEDKAAFLLAKSNYLEKYPEFGKMLEILEIAFQTNRAEYDRLTNLSIGYLRSVDLNNFEHWQAVSRQKWNYLVLTHKQVPQEFYTSILNTANKIRNEYFQQEAIYDSILSRVTDHASLYDILSQYPKIDISQRQLREFLIPIGLRALIQRNPWKNQSGSFIDMNGKKMSPEVCAKNMLHQLLVVLYVEDDNTTEEERESIIRINPKVFFEGFEEAIDLSMLIANKEYSQVLKVLQTTKTALGRLQDKDFQPFLSYYEHLGKIFLFHHHFTDTRPGLQRRGYQSLAQLYNAELGLTQTKVRAEINSLTSIDVKEINSYFEDSFFNKLIGIE
ncbi:MAG: hypothetical protein PHU93_02485 [Candidatus Gracilibacteria bacterium]|nr:hypothetical protein [Candidatus Gracilibacteria bacterium]